jgi:hypothetical protein
MEIAHWVLAAVLQTAPAPVLEIYPEVFANQEDCLGGGAYLKKAGVEQPLICFGATKIVPVTDPI